MNIHARILIAGGTIAFLITGALNIVLAAGVPPCTNPAAAINEGMPTTLVPNIIGDSYNTAKTGFSTYTFCPLINAIACKEEEAKINRNDLACFNKKINEMCSPIPIFRKICLKNGAADKAKKACVAEKALAMKTAYSVGGACESSISSCNERYNY